MSQTPLIIESIQLPSDVTLKVEQLWFEYNAGLKISRYLMRHSDVDPVLLDNYITETKQKWIELSLYMNEIVKIYPSSHNCPYYHFNFYDCTLEYAMESWDNYD